MYNVNYAVSVQEVSNCVSNAKNSVTDIQNSIKAIQSYIQLINGWQGETAEASKAYIQNEVNKLNNLCRWTNDILIFIDSWVKAHNEEASESAQMFQNMGY